MCGIVGIVGPQYRDEISRVNDSQRHRGPDDEGYRYFDDVKLALAMRRLSIVDIEGGHQPMVDPTGRYTIVFNGEVFNAPLLRKELEAAGICFRTRSSDTEVVLNLFAHRGTQCVSRLNGMFAFAVYDNVGKVLFLARDPLGIKPLYYIDQGGTFAFASELKSLMMLSAAPREVDRQSLDHYLTFQFIPAPHTIYTGIRNLPAGHSLGINLKSREVADARRYWQPRFQTSPENAGSYAESVALLRAQLERAADEWTMSDVDIGCSLSGGIDSAALVGLLASKGDVRLKTWTLGFEESGKEGSTIDERHLAAAVAARWCTDHHEIVIKATDLIEDLDTMVGYLDEPYAGGLPSWYVFREMSKQVKVAMIGTGGDELFGNYGKWRVLQPMTLPWLKQLRRRLIETGIRECLLHPHGALYPGYFGEKEKEGILAGSREIVQSSPDLVERLWQRAGSQDPKKCVAFVDLQMQLPEEFLLMTDRFSMAWSVEARPPFLDRTLVDFVLGLPSEMRSPSGTLKKMLIDAVRDLLPDEIVVAKKKGFVLPVATWLRRELLPIVKLYFGREFLHRQGVFRDDLYDRLVRPHIEQKADLSSKIWTVLMFQLWWNKNVGDNR